MQPTLKDLLARGADVAPALTAPGRSALTHGALRALIARTLATLNGLGLGRGDRIAIVLPNGPEMATCFVACASGATSAPLNPAYRAELLKLPSQSDIARTIGRMTEHERVEKLRELAQDYAWDVAGNFDPRVYKASTKILPGLVTGLLARRGVVGADFHAVAWPQHRRVCIGGT